MEEPDAKVHIAQKGKHSLLKLRFLPDEEREQKIRQQDFKEVANNKVAQALTDMQHQTQEAEALVQEKAEKFQNRFDALENKQATSTEDRI